MIQMSKLFYRSDLLKKRESLNICQVLELSKKINHNLRLVSEYHEAKTIGCYQSFKNEPHIHIDINKKYFLPKITNDHLNFYEDNGVYIKNRFGINEPKDSKKINTGNLDIILIPLLAFNVALFRVGFGKGFYDKTFFKLTKKQNRPSLIGIGYEFQLIEDNFQEDFDVRLDKIVTDSQIYESEI